MADYTFAQRTTRVINIIWKDSVTKLPVPIPAEFTTATASMGLTEKASTADDVALTVDLTQRANGVASITLTDEVTGAAKYTTDGTDNEYTIDGLFNTADGTRQRPFQITVLFSRTRTP